MSIILAVNELVEHSSIEHAVGIYIGLPLLACMVGIAAKLISHLPYTIFLTIIGLVIGISHFGPKIEDTGFGHGLISFVFLPPLLFQDAFQIDLDRLLKQLAPIIWFAVPGVIVSTRLTGSLIWWQGGIFPDPWQCGIPSLLIALLFGALISPTDPIIALAMFRKADAIACLRRELWRETIKCMFGVWADSRVGRCCGPVPG